MISKAILRAFVVSIPNSKSIILKNFYHHETLHRKNVCIFATALKSGRGPIVGTGLGPEIAGSNPAAPTKE